ncbi:MAG: (Fe-S)-binding protein [candidate division KSB1 bacterium]|nr:(Fe-S)-binding protein [candidate division KSB1 bacterium]
MFQNTYGRYDKTSLRFTRFLFKLFLNETAEKVDNIVKAALFIPCLSEHLYPESALNMVKVLQYLGVDIDYVENQTCCGQIEYNSGLRDEIVPVAEHFIELFSHKPCIVAPSGSCVAMVRKFYYDLDIRDNLKSARDELAGKIYEFTEFLVDVLQVTDLNGRFPHSVTYHDSCHLNRELGIYEQPRKLIRSISDINFIEMQDPDLCCGFGGTFSYKFKELSIRMVAQKCENISNSRAEYCIGADESCLMNIEGYLIKHAMKARTLHIATLLAKSLGL